MAGRNGRLVPPHLLEIDLLRFFPVELGELVERLGLLLGAKAGRVARVLAQVRLEQFDRLAARVGDLRLFFLQRLLQDRRQRLLGLLAPLVGVAFVGLSALVAGLVRGRERRSARGDDRQHQRERAEGRQGRVARSICNSRTHPTSTRLRMASTLRHPPSTLQAGAWRIVPRGSGRRAGARSQSPASFSCR